MDKNVLRSDVAKALGYDQPHKAVDRHCRYGTKHTVPHPQAPDKQIEMSFIPEGDVYRLITHSKLPLLMVQKKGSAPVKAGAFLLQIATPYCLTFVYT